MLDIKYIAGFFDGEGCIGIYFRKDPRRSRGGYYYLDVTVCQKYGAVVAELQEQFGGSLYTPTGNDVVRWGIGANQALPFLEEIEPYLIVKKSQALLAIDFQRRKQLPERAGPHTLTDEEFEYEKAISNILKELKR